MTRKDIPRTHDEIERIARAEDKAGVVDQQAAAERARRKEIICP